jgi:hypothetical protein
MSFSPFSHNVANLFFGIGFPLKIRVFLHLLQIHSVLGISLEHPAYEIHKVFIIVIHTIGHETRIYFPEFIYLLAKSAVMLIMFAVCFPPWRHL